LSFDHFWWAKLGLDDKKNKEASRFWRKMDLTDHQSKRLLFGSGSTFWFGVYFGGVRML
jgi:hypothetical protein